MILSFFGNNVLLAAHQDYVETAIYPQGRPTLVTASITVKTDDCNEFTIGKGFVPNGHTGYQLNFIFEGQIDNTLRDCLNGKRTQEKTLKRSIRVFSRPGQRIVISAKPSVLIRYEFFHSTRSLVDRPDRSHQQQIHVVYMVPSDGGDRGLDVDGTLSQSVAVFQKWLNQQTLGRRLRFDRYDQARLDVSFVRLNKSSQTMTGYGEAILDNIALALKRAGFNDPKKHYVVYYEGAHAQGYCGQSRANLPAVMYLLSLDCRYQKFSQYGKAGPEYLEFVMLHEILHSLGIVSASAPHAKNTHVTDGAEDLMYAGDQVWTPSRLDIGQDDYYGANVPSNAVNLATLPILLPTQDVLLEEQENPTPVVLEPISERLGLYSGIKAKPLLYEHSSPMQIPPQKKGPVIDK